MAGSDRVAGLRVWLARVLLLILAFIYWFAGWGTGTYPFQWSFPFVTHENVVEEAPAGELSFRGRGIAYTESAPAWVSEAIQDNAFEVELVVRAYNASQRGPARIFTLSQDHLNRNFTIGQASGSDLVVRLRTTATGSNGTPGYRLRKAFRDLDFHRIVVRVEPARMRITLDGRRLPSAKLPADALSNWNPEYRLALGNEFTFSNPWQGEIRWVLVRVRDAEFAYASRNLNMPATYGIGARPYLQKLKDSLLHPFYLISWRNVIINLVGFLPFGLLLAFASWRPLTLIVACGWCALMSLSIETGQIFLDGRFPSISDLVLNTAGGCVGAWMGNRIRRLPVAL